MSELYLIAHKVRGEPAFDVATRIECGICHGVGGHDVTPDYEGPSCSECDGTGYWWIIPTSGHRAYPYWHCALNKHIEIDWQADAMPPDLPDHYAHSAAPKHDRIAALLAAMPPAPVTPFKRRF